MEEEYEYFTFFRSYYETVKELSPRDQGIFWGNLMAYVFDGQEPKVQGLQKALFLCTKPHLDASMKKMESGRKGGQRKKADAKQSESTPQATDKQSASNKRTEEQKNLEQKNLEQEQTPLLSPQGAVEVGRKQEFEGFWALYPKKCGRAKAWAAWEELRPDPWTVAAIIAGVKAYADTEAWTKAGGQFIPAPDRFLRERRWEDEPHLSPADRDRLARQAAMRKNAEWMRRFLAEEDGLTPPAEGTDSGTDSPP